MVGIQLQDLELALTERLGDGQHLWAMGRNQGGVYNLGYHAEISLKYAYFRYSGLPITEIIDLPLLRRVSQAASIYGVTPTKNFHDLIFWKNILIGKRRFESRPLTQMTEKGLHQSINVISGIWEVEMRYSRPLLTTELALNRAIEATDWLDCHLAELFL